MKTSSDKMHDTYKDIDFADAKPVAETPHLAKLQAETGGKSGITIGRGIETNHETRETGLTTQSTGRGKKHRDD